ncbi:LysR substrate-binding domain-containing protein [Curvivirga aplysinae]|uniref:LysR substrate-binding domain-containing protein n=1 Tax=Curvivirga aplysinae TaxID=2529852 RepID=UPI0012BBC8FA|nr:LysR substrate-binding domain-containing protein [Curvivirga aplysinae]MTI10975.1 LysR family transcriptional regulator [Curvivirga aplysinae]
MARRYYQLPSLTTLAVFEAAARRMSFKDAAGELNVTSGAVSHQIKALEEDLDVQLFDRKYRGVELTENGQILFETLEKSFGEISRTLTSLRKSPKDQSVTIACTSAVSALWLTPKVSTFWREHSNIPVNQIISDGPMRFTENPDLRIQYGRQDESELEETILFQDYLVPLCAPALAEKLKGAKVEDLAQQHLFHLIAEHESWTTWENWFKQMGYRGKISIGSKVNNYTIALQAAQDGTGLVLGWQKLVSPLLKTRQLVALEEFRMKAPKRFYIAYQPETHLSEYARILKDWLMSHSET